MATLFPAAPPPSPRQKVFENFVDELLPIIQQWISSEMRKPLSDCYKQHELTRSDYVTIIEMGITMDEFTQSVNRILHEEVKPVKGLHVSITFCKEQQRVKGPIYCRLYMIQH